MYRVHYSPEELRAFGALWYWYTAAHAYLLRAGAPAKLPPLLQYKVDDANADYQIACLRAVRTGRK